ncbi:MAG: hypothetical protein KDA80_19345 [Planctomycetaceae bacterium]|nr:hypothetical protein [Planctomycetaceae bacterium]
MAPQTPQTDVNIQAYPVRAGIFETLESAKTAVAKLHQSGFSPSQISIVCSEESQREHFADEELTESSGSHTSQFLNRAGAVALGTGGVAIVALTLLTAGTTTMVGVGIVSGLAITGTLATLFGTRGTENEATDFYDQAVARGRLLVAVEAENRDEQGEEKLAKAETILAEAGGETVPLSH